MDLKIRLLISYLFIGISSVYSVQAFSQDLPSKLKSLVTAKEGNYYSAIIAMGAIDGPTSLNREWKIFYHYLVFKINPESAYKELKRLNEASPNIDNDLILGRLYLLDNKIVKAIASFQAALVKNPLNAEALEYLEQITKLKNSNRTIAEEQVDGNLVLNPKFIPNDLENNVLTVNVAETEKIPSKDISTIELALAPIAKKYDLSGVGFNAKVDYSTGVAFNVKYTFSPGEKKWNSHIGFSYSKTVFDDLIGLTPKKVHLNETKLAVGINFLLRNFSLGPVLVYESTSATRTTPSTLRGNSDFFNLGARFGYELFADEFTKIKVEAHCLKKVMSISRPVGSGTVSDRTVVDFSGKVYFRKEASDIGYFAGLGYSLTNNEYASSVGRGTLQAKEKEQDFSFPIGIDYAF